MTEADLTPVPIAGAAESQSTQVAMTAWQCEPCGVRGRTVGDADVVCWNCGEPATVTVRPAAPVELFALAAHHRRRLMS